MNVDIKIENLTENEIETLNELIKNANKPEKWEPMKKKPYYEVGVAGLCSAYIWAESCEELESYARGNIFRTQAEAEFESERKKAVTEYRKYAAVNNEELDWAITSAQEKYYVVYNLASGIQEAVVYSNKSQGVIYFTDSKVMRDAIEQIGEERFKKYVLEV